MIATASFRSALFHLALDPGIHNEHGSVWRLPVNVTKIGRRLVSGGAVRFVSG